MVYATPVDMDGEEGERVVGLCVYVCVCVDGSDRGPKFWSVVLCVNGGKHEKISKNNGKYSPIVTKQIDLELLKFLAYSYDRISFSKNHIQLLEIVILDIASFFQS